VRLRIRMQYPYTAGGRTLLVAGFGSLILLMIAAGVYALRTVEQVRTTDAQERDTYLRRNRALDRVRSGIYQSGTAVRDYLLATDPNASKLESERLAGIRGRTDQALAECASLIDPGDIPFRNLQAEVQVYWKLLEFVFQIPPENKQLRGSKYLSSEVVRHRA